MVLDAEDIERLRREIGALEQAMESWSPEQRAAVAEVRDKLAQIHGEALRRLVVTLKNDPGGSPALQSAVADPVVFGLLEDFGLVETSEPEPEPTLEERVEEALSKVRPSLAQHAGNVRLVEAISEREVRIALEGACNGCAFADVTVSEGIEAAIREAVPSVEVVHVLEQPPPPPTDALVRLARSRVTSSPFAPVWYDALPEDQVREGKVALAELERGPVILTRVGAEIIAYANACTHLGLPLDNGIVEGGVLECGYHGYRFSLETGACLTVPDTGLKRYPTRVEGGRVYVRIRA